MARAKNFSHGSDAMYRRGCKCQVCVDSHRERCRYWREGRRGHGDKEPPERVERMVRLAESCTERIYV